MTELIRPEDDSVTKVADYITNALIRSIQVLAGVIQFCYAVAIILGSRFLVFLSDPRTREFARGARNFAIAFVRELYLRTLAVLQSKGRIYPLMCENSFGYILGNGASQSSAVVAKNGMTSFRNIQVRAK